MSNSNNRMIVFASILGAILATGLLALNPSMITNGNARMYANDYGYDNYYNNYYPEPKSSHTDIQKINCVNSNLNVNGIDITQIPQDSTATAAANEEASPVGANAQNGNALADRINLERNLVNVCVNVNENEQIKGPPTCEDCFTQNLDAEDLENLFPFGFGGQIVDDLEELCNILEGLTTEQDKMTWYFVLSFVMLFAGISEEERQEVLDCLVELGLIMPLSPA